MRIQAAIATAAILTFAAGAANADAQKYDANLTGAAEVPAATTPARGVITTLFDTDNGELSYTVTFSGLSGPVTGADFHGPAGRTAQAPVTYAAAGTASPISGTIKLTTQHSRDLNAGVWYFNIETAANPNGEIRGQLRRDDY